MNRQRLYQLMPAGCVGLLVALVDQISKIAVFNYLDKLVATGESIVPARFVCSFFNLVMAWNKGISFGMLNQLAYGNIILVLTSCLILGLTLYYYRHTESTIEIYALALISGGAVGNLLDRIRFGAVADFLDFHLDKYHWPAFNVADATICLGVLGLIISEYKNYGKSSKTDNTTK